MREPMRSFADKIGRLLVVVAFLLGSIDARDAWAWGNQQTHQQLLQTATETLNKDDALRDLLILHYGLRFGLREDVEFLSGFVLPGPEAWEVVQKIPEPYRSYYRDLDALDSPRLRDNIGPCSEPSPQDVLSELFSPASQLVSVVRTPIQFLKTGVWAEDNPNPRARNHFHDPEFDYPTGSGNRGLDNHLRYTVEDPDDFEFAFDFGGPSLARLRLGSLCRGEGILDLVNGTAFDATGISALNRALNRDGAKHAPPLAGNRFDLGDAERYLYRYVVASSPEERKHALALHFLALGHVVHLLEDMTSPAHVRNDFIVDHLIPGVAARVGQGGPGGAFLGLASGVPGDEIVGLQLEDVGEYRSAIRRIRSLAGIDPEALGGYPSLPRAFIEQTNSLPQQSGLTVDFTQFAPVVASVDLADLAYGDFWDSGIGVGVSTQSVAPRVHDAFFSRATVAGAPSTLENPIPYVEPAASATTLCQALPLRDLDGKSIQSDFAEGVAYGRFVSSGLVPHLAACRVTSRQILDEAQVPPKEANRALTVIESSVQADYMELLFPMAVDYSAAFLESYFDPRIEIVPAGGGRFRVRSRMNRPFRFVNGTPEISYDGVDEARHSVPVLCDGDPADILELPPTTDPDEPAPLSTFTCGVEAELVVEPVDRGDYWIAFRGESVGNFGTVGTTNDYEEFEDGFFTTDFALAFARIRGRGVVYQHSESPLLPPTSDAERRFTIAKIAIPLAEDGDGIEPPPEFPLLAFHTSPDVDFSRPLVEPGGHRLVVLSDIELPAAVPDNPEAADAHLYLYDPAGFPDYDPADPYFVAPELLRLTDFADSRNALSSEAAWSRDGSTIFFWANTGGAPSDPREFVRFDVETRTRTTLTVETPEECEEPDASVSEIPAAFDASRLAMTFTCSLTGAGGSPLLAFGIDLFVMDVVGTDLIPRYRVDLAAGGVRACAGPGTCLATEGDFAGEGFGASFSPEGTQIAFTSRPNPDSGGQQGDRFLYVAGLAPGDFTIRVLNDILCVDKPSWSGSGDLIAFLGSPVCASQLYDIYAQPADGSSSAAVAHGFGFLPPLIDRLDLSWYEPLLLPWNPQ